MDNLKTLTAAIALATLAASGTVSAASTQGDAASQNDTHSAQSQEARPAKDQKMANRPDIRSGESVEDEMEEVENDEEQSGLGGLATGEEPVTHPSGRRSD